MFRSNQTRFFNYLIASLSAFLYTNSLLAAGGDGPYFSIYKNVVRAVFGLDEQSPNEVLESVRQFEIIPGMLVSTIIILVAGILYSKKANARLENQDYAPSSKISLSGILEATMKFVVDLAKDTIGHGYMAFVPLMVSLFIYILVNNIKGLTPGLPPATENMSTNFGMAILIFLVYNWAGIKEHGLKEYSKQFTGPVLLLSPLIVIIEIISHSARPFSLSLRMFVSLFADHTIVGVMGSIIPIGVPALFMLFGLLVAVIQAFIFVLLSCIYIGMAKSHDH